MILRTWFRCIVILLRESYIQRVHASETETPKAKLYFLQNFLEDPDNYECFREYLVREFSVGTRMNASIVNSSAIEQTLNVS